MLVLKDHLLRLELKNPLGFVFSTSLENLIPILKSIDKKIISVGDYTTHKLIQSGLTPKVAVIDAKIMRRRASDDIINSVISSYKRINSVILEVDNLSGTINSELLESVEDMLESPDYYLIIVRGEEDLLALPFILAQREDIIIIYGQPKVGSVVVSTSFPQLYNMHILSMERINLYSSVIEEGTQK